MNGSGAGIEGKGSDLRRQNLWRWGGLCLIIGGVALLGLAGAYYGYVRYSEAQWSPLVSTSPPPVQNSAAPPAMPTEKPAPTVEPSPAAPDATPTATSHPTDTPLLLAPAVRIVIPAIVLDAKVVEVPNYSEVAKFAVGHYPSANPGETGNIVMAGHLRSDLLNEGDIFKRLPDIRKYVGLTSYTKDGVESSPPSESKPVYISLYDANGNEYRYRAVETLVVLPSSTWILDPTPDETLTLITCVPEFSYDFRFVVRAKRVP